MYEEILHYRDPITNDCRCPDNEEAVTHTDSISKS